MTELQNQETDLNRNETNLSSNSQKFCKCGCGEIIKIKSCHKYYGIPDYINHHQFRGENNPFHGHQHSKETKLKQSLAKKGENHPMWGKNNSEESNQKRKVSVTRWHKEVGRSEETLKKIGQSSKERFTIDNPMKRPEVRKKVSEIHKIFYQEGKFKMPVKDSSIEIKIQNFLKQLNIEFFTHQYIKIEHGYQCDIFIPSKNLIIECDGDAFHFNPNKYNKDSKIFKNGMTAEEKWRLDELRTSELIEKGFKVLRMWENEIRVLDINNFQNKLMEIKN